jgi:hypothetical protein
MRPLRFFALASLVVGAAATAWAATELQGGAAELPNHWWSGAAIVVLGLGAAASLVAWRVPRTISRRPR